MIPKLLTLVMALGLLAAPALASPPPSPPDSAQALKQQIADLQKQLAAADKQGAYWQQIAIAENREMHAHDDADAPLIAFPPPKGEPEQ
jgi:hypothetical protein